MPDYQPSNLLPYLMQLYGGMGGGASGGSAPPGHFMMNLGNGPVAIPMTGPNGERLNPSQALLQYQQRMKQNMDMYQSLAAMMGGR